MAVVNKGFWFAVNVSTGIRLLYHLYEGPFALITILPMGLSGPGLACCAKASSKTSILFPPEAPGQVHWQS